ncbi:MAG: diguanylate cyclase [Syntrophomonadaceae bacterium]|nr:diguanylate cyclase [Syntrophomonadaceae bacterium]MDD4549030.1 diguanylate cyclase [Syntrophomonadaceae bacterium]
MSDYQSYSQKDHIQKNITLHKKIKELIKTLEESNKSFFKLADIIPASIFILQDNMFRYVNATFESITGYKAKDCKNISPLDLIHPNYLEMARNRLLIRQEGDSGYFRHEIQFVTKNGRELLGDLASSLINFEGGKAILGIVYELGNYNKIKKALQESKQRLIDVLNFFPDATFVIDNDGTIIAWNNAIEKMTGIKAQDILGNDNYAHALPFYGTRRPILIDMVLDFNEELLGYCPNIGEDGIFIHATASPLYDTSSNRVGAIESIKDITVSKQAEEKIKYLSYYDKLTGLYNRAFFEEELMRIDNNSNLPLSLIFGDVNGLKLVNDALGHHKGDVLLKKIAEVLKTSCRKEDIIVRWGGDEFVILLPKTNKETAQKICKRIKLACSKAEYTYIPLNIALGAASKENEQQNIKSVLKSAEDIMYRNKLVESKNNRNAFILSLGNILDARNHETAEHAHRIQNLLIQMYPAINIDNDELYHLNLLAALHDIGKISIPNSILNKPAKLSADEWKTIKKHPETGYRIALSVPELAPVAEAILAHHEHWDGSGYPLGLKGDEIPLLSRLLAIIDAYDVMLNGRPYKKAISHQETLTEIEACAGTQFDPTLVKIFLELMAKDPLMTEAR